MDAHYVIRLVRDDDTVVVYKDTSTLDMSEHTWEEAMDIISDGIRDCLKAIPHYGE